MANMKLCDLDEIKICVNRQYENCHGYSGNKKAIYREAILAVKSILHSAKPIDAVPVVRCKDCKHHYWEQEPCHGKTIHYCELPHMRGIEIFKEFFCYYGERKEGVENG